MTSHEILDVNYGPEHAYPDRDRCSHDPADVTAVVLDWCGEAVTTECLRSLQRSEYPALTLLLVDNGAPDQTSEKLRAAFPDISLLQTGENLGYAGGNNRGIEWALARGAEYVLIVNNDTVLEPGCVGALVTAASSGGSRIGATVPKILYHDQPDRIWYAGGDFSPLRGLGRHRREGERDVPSRDRSPEDVSFVTGCCCLLSAEALREVGGFDESFFAYVEDAELSLRLQKAGFRILYEPSARILHHSPPPGTPPTPFQIRQRDRNRKRLMRRHFGLARRLPFKLWFLVTRTLLLLRYLFAGDYSRARAILNGMFAR